MPTRGTVGFYDIDTTFGQNEQKRDVEDKMHLIDPSSAPLTAFTGKNLFAKLKANSRKYEWYTDDIRALKTTTATTGTGTSIAVATGTGIMFVPGDLAFLPGYGEVIRVDVIATDTLTVTRDVTSVLGGGATLAGTSDIIHMGQAAGEKAAVPADIFVNPTNNFNYAQLWIESVILSRDALKAQYYGYGGSGEKLRAHEHKKHVIRYNCQREMQAYFGQRGTAAAYASHATDSGQQFFTGGLDYAIATNDFDFGGVPMTESLLLSKTMDFFRYGNHNRKPLICSPQLSARISSWGLSAIRTQAGEGMWGYRISEWQTPHGVLDILPCWLLKDAKSGAAPLDGDIGFVVDMDDWKQVVVEPTSLERNVQNSESIRTVKDVYQGVTGWQWGVEKYHSRIYNWI